MQPELAKLMPSEKEAFTYYDYHSPKGTIMALEDFEAFLETDGPYDGVIAFSQGATLIGTWMIHQLKQQKSIQATFKCAIFLSVPAPPVDFKALQAGFHRKLTSADFGEIIDIPTAHIWGSEDGWSDAAKDFNKFCHSEMTSSFVHAGGHEVPGPGSKDAVTQCVNVIRRAIYLSTEDVLHRPLKN